MKVASSTYRTNLLATTQPIFADLLTFTFVDGTVTRLSLLDRDIQYGGNTYSSAGPYVQKGKRKQSRGMQADTLELSIFASPGQVVDLGLPMLRAVVAGLANGAIVQLD